MYCNKISNNLKTDFAQLELGYASASNENSIEVFYDFAITPAIRFIPVTNTYGISLLPISRQARIKPISF